MINTRTKAYRTLKKLYREQFISYWVTGRNRPDYEEMGLLAIHAAEIRDRVIRELKNDDRPNMSLNPNGLD